MDVFVRWRPLAESEAPQGSVAHKAVKNDKSSLLSVSINRNQTPSDREWNSSAAFHSVLNVQDDNGVAYSTIVEPTISQVLGGGSCSFFAYGHSGSGKTHTVIGYEHSQRSGLGLCLAAGERLFSEIQALNQNASSETSRLGVGLSVFEVRQKSAFDLLNNRTECHIREGPDGKVHIRGQTETLEKGKVRVKPIAKHPCWTYDALKQELLQALDRRAVGTSSVHDESSRTHAVLELEIINQPLHDAREALIERQSELVPVGKLHGDILIEEQSKGYIADMEGNYRPNPDYTINQSRIDAAEAEMKVFESRVEDAEKHIESIYTAASDTTPSLGGKMVFVDLAGAEYQQENRSTSAVSATKQTPTEKQEARQINTDLLALKEVFRAWATKQRRVPFRSSPLTMVLRETFMAAKNCGSGMIVTVSPAKGHYAATMNSLKYGSLMGSVQA
ncbi:hypothetical protein K4F52_003923 [Lecanicillium sp. MT-2017a]|nr:hypothetical protein K4F52_003923 [Lecanicillium sp. MT-2017a]